MKTTSMNYFYEILKKSFKHFIFSEILIIFQTVAFDFDKEKSHQKAKEPIKTIIHHGLYWLKISVSVLIFTIFV